MGGSALAASGGVPGFAAWSLSEAHDGSGLQLWQAFDGNVGTVGCFHKNTNGNFSVALEPSDTEYLNADAAAAEGVYVYLQEFATTTYLLPISRISVGPSNTSRVANCTYAFPPASELHTIHRSRVTDVPTMTLFVDPNPNPSSPINSSAGTDDETRIWRSIQPTDVGSDLSGIVRSFSTNCCFLTAATGATPADNAELPATH